MNEKVVLPSLNALISENSPDVEIKAPVVLDIPTEQISASMNLPKKIIEEPESTYEPPKLIDIDINANASIQPPLINALISGGPETPVVVESKANKPDINVLRKKSSNKDVAADITATAPSVSIEGPSLKVDGGNLIKDLSSGIKAKVDVDLGKGKISAEVKKDKKGDKKEDKKEEPKKKPIQMKDFISQDVNAPIHPVRRIPKIKIFKGFPAKKKK